MLGFIPFCDLKKKKHRRMKRKDKLTKSRSTELRLRNCWCVSMQHFSAQFNLASGNILLLIFIEYVLRTDTTQKTWPHLLLFGNQNK